MAAGGSPPGSAGGGTRPVDVVPVPAALFGPLLERVTDVTTLRCALRAVFVLHRKQGRPSVVTARELADDPVLGLRGDEPAAERALESLAELGVLLRASTGDGGAGYCMDTPANRRAVSATGARVRTGRSRAATRRRRSMGMSGIGPTSFAYTRRTLASSRRWRPSGSRTWKLNTRRSG